MIKFFFFFFVWVFRFGSLALVHSCRDLMHIVFVHYLEVKVIHFALIVIASLFAFVVVAVLSFSYLVF